MDTTQITSSLGYLGNKVSEVTQWIIVQISNWGVKTTATTARLINILLFSLLLYIVVKFVTFARRPLKWLIVGILGILIISIGISFFN